MKWRSYYLSLVQWSAIIVANWLFAMRIKCMFIDIHLLFFRLFFCCCCRCQMNFFFWLSSSFLFNEQVPLLFFSFSVSWDIPSKFQTFIITLCWNWIRARTVCMCARTTRPIPMISINANVVMGHILMICAFVYIVVLMSLISPLHQTIKLCFDSYPMVFYAIKSNKYDGIY